MEVVSEVGECAATVAVVMWACELPHGKGRLQQPSEHTPHHRHLHTHRHHRLTHLTHHTHTRVEVVVEVVSEVGECAATVAVAMGL